MKEKIENFLELKSKITEELKEFVKDKSIPLEDRWSLFIESGLSSHKNCIQDFKTFNIEDYHCNSDRYETIEVTSIIEYLNYGIIDLSELSELYEKYIETYPEDEEVENQEQIDIFMKQIIDSFKEECLDRFLYSYTID